MKPNKLVIVNQDYFNDYGFENHFYILSLVEKEISTFRDGEADEVLAVTYGKDFILFDFVKFEEQNCYHYEFTGSVK